MVGASCWWPEPGTGYDMLGLSGEAQRGLVCKLGRGASLSGGATGADTVGSGVQLAVAIGCPRGLSCTAQ